KSVALPTELRQLGKTWNYTTQLLESVQCSVFPPHRQWLSVFPGCGDDGQAFQDEVRGQIPIITQIGMKPLCLATGEYRPGLRSHLGCQALIGLPNESQNTLQGARRDRLVRVLSQSETIPLPHW